MEVIIKGAPKEIAALVRATQERRDGEPYAPFEVIKESVRRAIGDTGPTKKELEPDSS